MKLVYLVFFLLAITNTLCQQQFTWDPQGPIKIGDAANAQNWLNGTGVRAGSGVPGNQDTAIINGGPATLNFGASFTVREFRVLAQTKFNLQGSSITVTSENFTQAAQTEIFVSSGNTFTTSSYFIFNNNANTPLTFNNFGTVNINLRIDDALVNGEVIVNGNAVNVTGTQEQLVFSNSVIPAGVVFSTTNQIRWVGASTLTFLSRQSISTNGWRVLNLRGPTNFVFNSGVDVSAALVLDDTAVTSPRPTVTFSGDVSVTTAVSWDANVVISGTGTSPSFTINGGAELTFPTSTGNSLSLNVDTITSTGNSKFTFTNSDANIQRQVNINNNIVTVVTSGFEIRDRTNFGGNTLIFNTARTLTYRWIIGTGATIGFASTTTINTGFNVSNSQGAMAFQQGLNSQINYDFTVLQGPITRFVCPQTQLTFAFTGSSTFGTLNFIGACVVSATTPITVNGGFSVQNGNVTLPNSNNVLLPNGATFTGSTPFLNSIILPGPTAWTVRINQTWTVNSVEVIVQAVLNMDQNSRLSSTGSLFFTLTQGLATISTGVTINANIAFPNGQVTLSGANSINPWGGSLFLRNTVLTGTLEVWFSGTINSAKGASQINMQNFRLKGGVTFGYIYDNISPDTSATITIGGTPAPTNRFIEFAVTAQAKTVVVFDDLITQNRTMSYSTTGDNSIVQFNKSPHTFALDSNSNTIQTTFTNNANIFFNNADYRLTGVGSLDITTSIIHTIGNVNNPFQNGDITPTQSANTLRARLFANSAYGPTFNPLGALETFDDDNNNNVASRTLTFSTSVTMFGQWTLGANIVLAQNLVIATTTAPTGPGFIQINGNSVVLNANAVWTNNVIFSQATTISCSNGNSQWTLREDNNAPHGLVIPGTFTINGCVTLTLESTNTVPFAVGITGGITGLGNLVINTVSFSTGSAVTFSTASVSITRSSFTGGSYAISPANGNLVVNGVIVSNSAVTYNGNTLTSNTPATLDNNFAISSNPITFKSNAVTFNGPRTVSGSWITEVNLVFNGDVTFANGASITQPVNFGGTPVLTFITAVIINSNLNIELNVVLGNDNTKPVILSNGGFTLTLSSRSVTVNAIVTSAGGFIVSTSPPGTIQRISGSGTFPNGVGVMTSAWTWSNTVILERMNVTGTRTLSFNVQLGDNSVNGFVDGLILNGGTITYEGTGGSTATAHVSNFIQTDQPTVIPSQIAVTVRRTQSFAGFEFRGTSNLSINSTFSCRAPITVSRTVIFGFNNFNPANPVYNVQFTMDPSCQFFGTSSIVFERTTMTNNVALVTIPNPVTFSLSNQQVAITGQQLLFNGNLNIYNTQLDFGANSNLGPITITTFANTTLNNVAPTDVLTFASGPSSTWIEPIVSFRVALNQIVNLQGPVRCPALSITNGGNFVGTGNNRVALVNSVTHQHTGDFSFNAPVQWYVENLTPNTFTISISGASVTYRQVPSTFNPRGLPAANIQFNGNNGNLRFNPQGTSSPLVIGDFNYGSSNQVLRIISGSITSNGKVTVSNSNTLWMDGGSLNTQNLVFSSNTIKTQFSIFQITISSQFTTPPVQSGAVLIQGQAVVNVNNFQWTGAALPVISGTFTSGSGVFDGVTGTQGYIYQQSRNGNNLQFSATIPPSVAPFPTQSNGPSPKVSSSVSFILNFALLISTLLFALF